MYHLALIFSYQEQNAVNWKLLKDDSLIIKCQFNNVDRFNNKSFTINSVSFILQ